MISKVSEYFKFLKVRYAIFGSSLLVFSFWFLVLLKTGRFGLDICAPQPLVRNHHTTEATHRGPLRSSMQSPSAPLKCRRTSAANARSGISWSGATRPSRGSLALRQRTGVGCSQNLTGVSERWHTRRVTTSTSRCRIPLRTL